MPDDDQAEKVYISALELLQQKPLSEKELRGHLQERQISESTISYTLERLTSLGYINAHAIADHYLNEAQRELRGPLWLEKKLEKKQLNHTVTLQALLDARAISQNLAMTYLQKNSPSTETIPRKEAQRLYRRLLSRGFEPEEAETAMLKSDLVSY